MTTPKDPEEMTKTELVNLLNWYRQCVLTHMIPAPREHEPIMGKTWQLQTRMQAAYGSANAQGGSGGGYVGVPLDGSSHRPPYKADPK